MTPDTHKLISIPREKKRGGGVALIHNKGFAVTVVDSTANKLFQEFEHLDCVVKSDRATIRLCTVYRPPPQGNISEKTEIL